MADLTWMMGGPQGSGVESGASIFSRVCAGSGYRIFGKREFYSNIKGEHSYFAVRVSDSEIRSNVDGVDLLVAFDAETVFRHFDEVAPGGAIIYDSEIEGTEASRVHTLDAPFRSRLDARLGPARQPPTVAGALAEARGRGVLLFPVPFRSLLEELAAETGNERLRGMVRMYNVIGVSLSLGLVGIPRDSLMRAIGEVFSAKPQVAELNRQAAEHSYGRALGMEGFAKSLPGVPKRPGTIIAQGHYGTSIGKMVCGCRFQSYYPITPASDESVYLESHEILEVRHNRPGSTVVIQAEDEISAIGMMIGAALTGARSSTSTSGPGFALMAEALGWAGINEVPIVITLYQRSGPSTGLPTRHGQDDLLFAVFAGHGDFAKLVYASGDIEESFYDTCNCFNYADVYQVPVIHMMDKFLSSSVVTCGRFDPSRVTIDRGKLLERIEGEYRRFEITGDGISPRAALGMKGGVFWNTGDESDELGHITEDPQLRIRMMDKRMSRLDAALEGIPPEQQAVSFGVHEHTVVSWGSTKGPVLDAISVLRGEGIDVGFVQVKLVHPFPSRLVESLLEGAATLIDVEANHSAQLARLFRQATGREMDYYILKYTGRGMTSTEVCDSLRNIVRGGAQRRQVLAHGA